MTPEDEFFFLAIQDKLERLAQEGKLTYELRKEDHFISVDTLGNEDLARELAISLETLADYYGTAVLK